MDRHPTKRVLEERPWRLFIDTGGTFTDCLAYDPEGHLHRAKVLSSSALRGAVIGGSCEIAEGRLSFGLRAAWHLPADFAVGADLHWLDRAPSSPMDASARWEVVGGAGDRLVVALPGDGSARIPEQGERFELRFPEEPPILAARLVTGSPRIEDLPALDMRLATTRGTNALLERRGAPTVFFVTRGFGDLLRIGDQRRPELFARRIVKPEPLYGRVVEVAERVSADGSVLLPLDGQELEAVIREVLAEGFESAAIALMHSWLRPGHEEELEERLLGAGFGHVSLSAELSPTLGFLPRAQTAVVDAYLSPIIDAYLESVRSALARGQGTGRLHVMTSAGGLVSVDRYRAKDSLLSGPAGGVVGAAHCGRRLGFGKVVAFDMGGTSTDVSRFDGDFEYRYEQQVGGARVAAPMLAIETVAAGGGSICHLEGGGPRVGPKSAGAFPGPACYGAGGPLTLTDINLLLGRLDPARFGVPLVPEAAEAAADALLEELRSQGAKLERYELLGGFLAIANQRMADAVRRISIRQGYDPRDYALVAFGGAGGQHACAVAELLAMEVVLLPRDAGLLSAVGLSAAVIERFATAQVLRDLGAVDLDSLLTELEERALAELAAEGVNGGEVRGRLAFLRLRGQESTLAVPIPASEEALDGAFLRRYVERYGYEPAKDRAIELESLRVVASAPTIAVGPEEAPGRPFDRQSARPICRGTMQARFGDRELEASVYDPGGLEPGQRIEGPALVFDAHASLTLEPGWYAEVHAGGLVCRRRTE